MSGEKRVQALGKFQDYEVCRPCAEEQLHAVCSPGKSVLSRCAVFGGIFLLGVFVSVLFRSGAAQIRFFGVAAMICGALGIYEAIRNARRHRLEYQAMSDQDALQEAAWEVLLANAPKKSEDSDLSYIPVDKRTLAMKKGDLMNVYDLLPEIAVKAYDLIRSGD
ncbi:MAG: hypothetical protein Q4B03_06465 [Lachnospiraceae bacterium]|nr:hypothetical protein [Lachnospiraceae bacterium]